VLTLFCCCYLQALQAQEVQLREQLREQLAQEVVLRGQLAASWQAQASAKVRGQGEGGWQGSAYGTKHTDFLLLVAIAWLGKVALSKSFTSG
jgi:hypothetical protein